MKREYDKIDVLKWKLRADFLPKWTAIHLARDMTAEFIQKGIAVEVLSVKRRQIKFPYQFNIELSFTTAEDEAQFILRESI